MYTHTHYTHIYIYIYIYMYTHTYIQVTHVMHIIQLMLGCVYMKSRTYKKRNEWVAAASAHPANILQARFLKSQLHAKLTI